MEPNEQYVIDPPAAEQEAAPRGPRKVARRRPLKLQRKPSVKARVEREEPREDARESARTQGPRLQRNRKRTDDKFFIDKNIIPTGMDYNWKRESCYGQVDKHHINALKDNHWTEVPEGRHPGLIVRQDGQVLMERPKYLSDEARNEDLGIAIDQVQGVGRNLTQTPGGTFTRDHPSVRANTRLSREYSPLNIPE